MALRRPATTDVEVKETSDTAEAVKDTTVTAKTETTQETNQGPKDDAPNIGDEAASDAATGDAAVGSNADAGDTTQAAAAPTESGTAEAQAAPEASQAVAARDTSTAVAAAPAAEHRVAGAMKQFTNEMAEQGFEGLELTGMSFDRVKLHEATYQLGSDDTDIGDVIQLQVLSTRNVYVVRQHSGQKSEVFYSYDPTGQLKADGSSAAEILEKWKEDGYGPEDWNIKTYLEAMAKLVNRDDEYNEAMVMLSIPPASKNRMAGAIAGGLAQFKTKNVSDLLIECKVGKKIGSGDEAFRPWVINAKGLIEQE